MLFIGIFQPAAVLWHLSGGRFDIARHANRAWRVYERAIIMNADRFLVDSSKDVVIAEKNVKIIRSKAQITSAMSIFDQKNDIVNMTGGVNLTDPPIVAFAISADYDIGSKRVALYGGAKAKRDANELSGDKITVYLGQNRLVVEGGTKAKIKEVEIK